MVRGIQIASGDNVATLLSACARGDEILIVGQGAETRLPAREAIPEGHKIALRPIPEGGKVVKFSTSIGRALLPIEPGAWVHLHNLASEYDARSQTFDLESGAPTDTRYR